MINILIHSFIEGEGPYCKDCCFKLDMVCMLFDRDLSYKDGRILRCHKCLDGENAFNLLLKMQQKGRDLNVDNMEK